jgi:hypothetical protein
MPEACGVENRERGGGQRELSTCGRAKPNHKKPSIRLRKGAQDDASSPLHVMDARVFVR